MADRREFEFDQLETADLVVDATYRGGTSKHAGDDPLDRLLGCGIGGGFRAVWGPGKKRYALVCLYTSLADPDWPDALDEQTGTFVYYGDNKRPGHTLTDTPRKGNTLLETAFAAVHEGPGRDRAQVDSGRRGGARSVTCSKSGGPTYYWPPMFQCQDGKEMLSWVNALNVGKISTANLCRYSLSRSGR